MRTGFGPGARLSGPGMSLVPAAAVAVVSSLLALASCTPIMLEGDRDVDRRVYVNDKAPNDSLPKELLGNGVKFVLQPGKPYVFSVTTARTSDILDVYSLQSGGQRSFKKINAIHDGVRQVFTFTSPLSTASFYAARLLTNSQAGALSSIQGVNLESQADQMLDTLRVKLLFVQTLHNLPNDLAKDGFAASFFAEMNKVLRPYSVVVAGITEIVDPNVKALVFPFSNIYVPLAGKRVANHAHLYLVDSISVGNPDTGPVGEVLGFAAREVVDISEHRESRVILANRASIARLAVTAAHELGHFFGLRHTVSTRHDMLQDQDASNIEDGFGDTRMCVIDQSFLGKLGSARAETAVPGRDGHGPETGPYCLRMGLRIGDNSCSERSCDLQNLMHPVECGFTQTTLSPQQIAFLKRNMALYQR